MTASIIPFSAELAQQLLESADGFPVDFDLAWQWSGYNSKAKGLKALKLYFSEGEDFFTPGQKVSTGGRPSVEILLTVDCFKELAMVSKSEQGKAVRKYFLECERIAKRQPAPLSVMDMIIASAQAHKALEARQEETERLLREAIAQKDEEIRQLKATVDVVDMESQANSAELERFRNGHGFYFSIAGWCSKHGVKLSLQDMNNLGRKATAMCKQVGIQPVPVNDPRWGKVNTYPDSVLMELV